VAVSNGTAALHAAVYAIDLKPGDEVIVPAMTFAASANAVLYNGATPIFADVSADTLLLDPEDTRKKIGPRTRAILGVDFAGQPCEYGALRALAEKYALSLIADASHSLGASYHGLPVGRLADLTTFSFHPVKHLTTGEGGMVVTAQEALAERMRCFRNHGISTDFKQREQHGTYFYEMQELGFNYRLSDLQCALGISQLGKLSHFIERRLQIAAHYDRTLGEMGVRPLARLGGAFHTYHLYVVQLDLARWRVDRDQVYRALRAEGIGVGVHYIPVPLHPYYQRAHGTRTGQCPAAEAAYQRILSLPIFPAMTEGDVGDVIEALGKVFAAYRR
jgi:perosamine synthetase